MQLILGQGEVKRVCDLPFGLFLCTGVYHGQSGRNAEGRIAEVATFFPNSLIEIVSEIRIPSAQFHKRGCGHAGRRIVLEAGGS